MKIYRWVAVNRTLKGKKSDSYEDCNLYAYEVVVGSDRTLLATCGNDAAIKGAQDYLAANRMLPMANTCQVWCIVISPEEQWDEGILYAVDCEAHYTFKSDMKIGAGLRGNVHDHR